MEITDPFALVSRWLHIGAAILAVGGAAFQFIALRPASRSALDAEESARLHEAIRARWSRVIFGSIFVLLLTGFANFYWLALAPKVPAMPYHALFGVKLLLALTIFFIASALAGHSAGLARIRAKSQAWLAALLALAAVVVLISGMLAQVRAAAGPAGP